MGKNGNIHPTRIFKEPNELLNAFNEYKQHVQEQSKEWLKVQYVGKEGQRMEGGHRTDNARLRREVSAVAARWPQRAAQGAVRARDIVGRSTLAHGALHGTAPRIQPPPMPLA